MTEGAGGAIDGAMAILGSLLDTAIQRRGTLGLPEPGVTNCYRLFDGADDGIGGLEIDNLAGHWVVGTRGIRWRAGLEELALARGAHSVWWKDLGEEKRGLEWRAGERLEGRFEGRENRVRLWLDLQAGYSQGIFLDQRLNRARVGDLAAAQAAGRSGEDRPRWLNAFAYTGGFSLAAARGGARVTTLDLGQPYLDWARDNFRLNQLDPDDHFWVRGDALDWLRRWGRAGRSFAGIVLDPPTFGRHGREVWRVERDLAPLVASAVALLDRGGVILVSSNWRGWTEQAFLGRLREGGGVALTWEVGGMPPEFGGENYLRVAWGRRD